MFEVTVVPSNPGRERLFERFFGPANSKSVRLGVSFSHFSYVRSTLCYIEGPEMFIGGPSQSWTGAARCHPKDQFCKAVGRKVALEDVLFMLPFDRAERRQVWNAYWNALKASKIPEPLPEPLWKLLPTVSSWVVEQFGWAGLSRS